MDSVIPSKRRTFAIKQHKQIEDEALTNTYIGTHSHNIEDNNTTPTI